MSRVAFGAMLVGLLVGVASPAAGEPYWIAWEGDDLPENQGWTRMWGNWQGPYQGPGAHRTLENGILTYDSLYDPGVVDFSYVERPGQVNPEPGQFFAMEWRLKVEHVVGRADPTVGVFSDDAWAVAFEFAEDKLYCSFEDYVTISIAPGVFHEYRMVSEDMRTYTLSVDGLVARNGFFKRVFSTSEIGWGDGIQGAASLHRWDYFRVGSVPEPATATILVALMSAATPRRR